jgi:hypothetical protein
MLAVLVALMGALACGRVGPGLHVVAGAHTPKTPATVATKDGALPDVITCVSGALPADEASSTVGSEVLRVNLGRGDGEFSAVIEKGQMFATHQGVDALPPAATPDERIVHLVPGAKDEVHFIEHDKGPAGLTIDVKRDGVVWTGTLVDDQCDQHTELALTCWSDEELFGSPWGGKPGILPAHFDWTSETCLDANGRLALNKLPIEVVRETGNGECADLSGASLNDADTSMPNLDGWILTGAKLDAARLFLANLRGASLQGADLSNLQFGYASITGTVDDATKLPGGPDASICQVTKSPWSGDSVTCND